MDSLFWGVLGILAAVVAKVLADDARTGIPKISAALIRQAVKWLPAEHQERWCEEWLAALAEMEERSRMLAHAIGCLFVAAPRIRAQLSPKSTYFGKRTLDVFISITAATVLIPPIILMSIIIIIMDGNPILYRHSRIGRYGKAFNVYKFRTMQVDSDRVLEDALKASPESRAEWIATGKLRHDPRILPGIGRFMRTTSIDELPMLWNVIKGDMSLVGPRPKWPDEAGDAVKPVQTMRPGLTGPSQVRRYLDEESNDGDENYRASLMADLRILLATVLAVLRR